MSHQGLLRGCFCFFPCCLIRASVVMVDYSLPEPYFIAKHPMFLPSEMFLEVKSWFMIKEILLPRWLETSSRFASIYAYDQELFKRRFLGEDGVSWLSSCSVCSTCSYHWLGYRSKFKTQGATDVSLLIVSINRDIYVSRNSDWKNADVADTACCGELWPLIPSVRTMFQ